MKKVYILTFHRPINFGATLQSTATLQYLKSQGYNAFVVDYRHERIEMNRKLIGGRWDSNRFILENLKSLIKDILNYHTEVKINQKFDEFVKKNMCLTSKCIDTTLNEIVADAEALVVGSDLVWNWELDRALNKVFFLDFETSPKCAKVSYASSIGSSYIPDDLLTVYKKELSKFDHISVREYSAKLLLDELIDKDVNCVVDPTFLLTADKWKRFEKPLNVPEHYVLLYLLEDEENAKQIAKETVRCFDCPILYYSRKKRKYGKNRLSYNYIDVGPDEFLYLVRNADFVVTNSFHGTAFSVIYDVPFVSIPHSTRGCRMVDFLNAIGAQEHCCGDVNAYDIKSCRQKLSPEARERLENWIQESQMYLKQALT